MGPVSPLSFRELRQPCVIKGPVRAFSSVSEKKKKHLPFTFYFLFIFPFIEILSACTGGVGLLGFSLDFFQCVNIYVEALFCQLKKNEILALLFFFQLILSQN